LPAAATARGHGVIVRGRIDVANPLIGAKTPRDCFRSSGWRRLWPAYCIAFGILLILVGGLA